VVARAEGRASLDAQGDRIGRDPALVMGAVVADRLGVAGKDPGSRLLGGLLGVVVDGVGLAAAREGAQEMRRAINEGRLERRLGPFVVNDGLAAFGDVATTSDGGTLELRGTCDGKAVSLVLLLEKHDSGSGKSTRSVSAFESACAEGQSGILSGRSNKALTS
jgi:hypothetical protein